MFTYCNCHFGALMPDIDEAQVPHHMTFRAEHDTKLKTAMNLVISPACLASIATFPIIPLYAGVSPPSLTICLFLFCITGHTIPCHPDEPMKTDESCMTNSSLFMSQSKIDALQSIHLI